MTTKIHGTDNVQPDTVSEQSFASTLRLGPRILGIQVTDSNYQAVSTSLSTTNDNYIVVTGENFVNSTVSVGAIAGGNLKLAVSTQAVSTSELRVCLPPMLTGLYSLFITNQTGKYTIGVNQLEYYPTDIQWTTSKDLVNPTFPLQLTATGGTITYTSSNIPGGLTLSSTGLLSGQPTAQSPYLHTLQFTVVATNPTSQYPRLFRLEWQA